MTKEEHIAKSDFIITFGSMLADNKEPIRNKVIESIAKRDAQFIYMHPIDNFDMELYYNQFIKYEVGSEEGICALLMDTFLKEAPAPILDYIANLDLGYISAESSAGEEEFEEIYEKSLNAKYKTLIIGDDIIEHERIDNIIKLLTVLKKYTDFHIIVLNDNLEERLNFSQDSALEDVAEIKSFNGTLVYRLMENERNNELQVSQSFANIAKVENSSEVYIKNKDEKIKKVIKIDEKLKGTIAILRVKEEQDILRGYRYKQVKIEKV